MGFAVAVGAQDTPAGVTIHVVQRGETVYAIAQRYGLTVDVIARANGIINPSSVLVGQRLLIPLGGVAETPSTPETYVVQPADNLQAIANAFGTTVEALVRLNGLSDPNALFVGQELILRDGASAPASPETAPEQPAAGGGSEATVNTLTHRIQAGESLFGIAQRYGVTMDAIQTANGITDPSRILAGQELIIPGGRVESATGLLPTGIGSVDVTPLVWREGKTGRIRLTTPNPATVSIGFLGQTLVVSTPDGGLSHVGFAAIPLATVAGVYPISITVTDALGVSTLTFNVQVREGGYPAQAVTLPDDKLTLLAPAVEQNENDLLRRVTAPYSAERYFAGPMGLPAAAAMYSAYGAKRAYNGGAFDRYHTGADFAGAPGTPIIAAAAGRVVLADTLNIRGTTVVLDHGWGVYTLYAHMNERYVGIGEVVRSGQALGTIGATGRATGAHLHWELWVNGTPVDPMQWVAEAFP
jgi:murein DD-endopeptidase MepM/ murein hydrolase activator NlpD